MKNRKLIAFRVPLNLVEVYEDQAKREGHGTLSGWIISVLNERTSIVNKLLTINQNKNSLTQKKTEKDAASQ